MQCQLRVEEHGFGRIRGSERTCRFRRYCRAFRRSNRRLPLLAEYLTSAVHARPSPSAAVACRRRRRRLAVSTKTVRRLLDRGELPGYRVGSAIRLDPVELEDWLKKGAQPWLTRPGSCGPARGRRPGLAARVRPAGCPVAVDVRRRQVLFGQFARDGEWAEDREPTGGAFHGDGVEPCFRAVDPRKPRPHSMPLSPWSGSGDRHEAVGGDPLVGAGQYVTRSTCSTRTM